MSEPEELLIDAALHTTIAARALWRRARAEPGPLQLSDVRVRIELFVTAACGSCPTITAADPPLAASWLQRLVRGRTGERPARETLASTDGARIRLPRVVEPSRGDAGDLALLRLLALEMAQRVQRKTCDFLPDELLDRELFLLAEGVAVDAQLVQELPGLARELSDERARALAARGHAQPASARERAVEALVQRALASAPDHPALPVFATPASALAWAREQARAIGALRGGYRGVAKVAHWGRVERASHVQTALLPAPGKPERAPQRRRVAELARTPRARPPSEARDEQPGVFVVKPDAAQQSVEDPHGLSRPADRELAPDLADLADALSELPEAELVRSEQLAAETLLSGELPARAARAAELAQARGHVYPEWDASGGCYRMPGAVVREPVARLGELSAARAALARHGALVHEVRRRFERLRLRPRRTSRQLDGDEIDLGAYVAAFADRSAGLALDDRLYLGSPRVQRELAVCVLLDASASTDAWVNGVQRVIDVEKDALLVVSEALERLADRYALLAFSGETSSAVDVVSLKSFDERAGAQVQRRIAALEPDRYTRLGAALRHATALLGQQPMRHRLLLLLSDGKPNDVDEYEGAYGVEDARRAAIEARALGVQLFCLAVDRHAPLYAPRIFGAHGFAVLARAERLPHALVQVLKQLVAC